MAILRTQKHPCYIGSNPSIRGCLGILRVDWFRCQNFSFQPWQRWWYQSPNFYQRFWNLRVVTRNRETHLPHLTLSFIDLILGEPWWTYFKIFFSPSGGTKYIGKRTPECNAYIFSLKLSWHVNKWHFKRDLMVFQATIFRGKLAVSFREVCIEAARLFRWKKTTSVQPICVVVGCILMGIKKMHACMRICSKK